jgi:plasmid stabilization system protein ParE
MLPVDYLPGARADFDESFDWYAERSPNAAVHFLNAVESALTLIAADPQRFSARDDIHRECPVRRFPFRIIYRITEDRILVVAIAHAKRHPDYWKHRD